MIIFVITSIVLVLALSFINRVRGSGSGLVYPFTDIHDNFDIHSRIIATILFGFAISMYAWVNNIFSPHASSYLTFGGWDFGLFLMAAIGFLTWCCLGWGDYLDMGTYQRTNPDGIEVVFIDNTLNWFAAHFDNLFIRRDVWIVAKWDTLHARTDLLGMTIRMFIMAIPIFIFFAWYYSNPWLIAMSGFMALAGPIYFFWSKMNIKGYWPSDFTGPAEWTTGVLWGLIIVFMFYKIKH